MSIQKFCFFSTCVFNSQAMITERICIYPKDVMLITGRSERSGCRLLQTIRKKYNKTKHQFVSIFEFSEYTGLQIEEIRTFLE
jgi:hypothetical protein